MHPERNDCVILKNMQEFQVIYQTSQTVILNLIQNPVEIISFFPGHRIKSGVTK
jgi:hypothetical protein